MAQLKQLLSVETKSTESTEHFYTSGCFLEGSKFPQGECEWPLYRYIATRASSGGVEDVEEMDKKEKEEEDMNAKGCMCVHSQPKLPDRHQKNEG